MAVKLGIKIVFSTKNFLINGTVLILGVWKDFTDCSNSWNSYLASNLMKNYWEF